MEEELEKNVGRDMTPRLIKDLGMRFATEKSNRKHRYGLYECQYCNKEFEARTTHIKREHIKSCGCLRGDAYGLTSHRFYGTWRQMVDRCTNPKIKAYKDYGGRGISVCEEWLDVRNFITWAEKTYPNIEGVSLDRIDNDKGYSPENCTWSDKTTQCINQRIRKDNKSGYVGVGFNKSKGKWEASLKLNNIYKYIGSFHTIKEAVQARDNYIIENNLPHKLSTDYKREDK